MNDDDPLSTYAANSAEIDAAIRRRMANGSREPVMPRDPHVRAAPAIWATSFDGRTRVWVAALRRRCGCSRQSLPYTAKHPPRCRRAATPSEVQSSQDRDGFARQSSPEPTARRAARCRMAALAAAPAVDLPLGKVLYESGSTLGHVYFPTTSIVSLLYVMEDGASAEIAVVGHEGIVGIALFMGGGSTPSRAVVQSAGQGFRLGAAFTGGIRFGHSRAHGSSRGESPAPEAPTAGAVRALVMEAPSDAGCCADADAPDGRTRRPHCASPRTPARASAGPC
jgi:hypothetical protein